MGNCAKTQTETTVESRPRVPHLPVPDMGSSQNDNDRKYQLESSQDDDEYIIKHYDDKTKFFKQTIATKTDIETLKFENISLLQIYNILYGECANYIASHIMELYITPPMMENQSNINALMDIFNAVHFKNKNFHRLNTNHSTITIDINNIKNQKDKKIILYIIKRILGNTKAHILIHHDDDLPLVEVTLSDRKYFYRHYHKKAKNKEIKYFLWIFSLMEPIISLNGINSPAILECTIGDEDVYIPKFEDMKLCPKKIQNNDNQNSCNLLLICGYLRQWITECPPEVLNTIAMCCYNINDIELLAYNYVYFSNDKKIIMQKIQMIYNKYSKNPWLLFDAMRSDKELLHSQQFCFVLQLFIKFALHPINVIIITIMNNTHLIDSSKNNVKGTKLTTKMIVKAINHMFAPQSIPIKISTIINPNFAMCTDPQICVNDQNKFYFKLSLQINQLYWNKLKKMDIGNMTPLQRIEITRFALVMKHEYISHIKIRLDQKPPRHSGRILRQESGHWGDYSSTGGYLIKTECQKRWMLIQSLQCFKHHYKDPKYFIFDEKKLGEHCKKLLTIDFISMVNQSDSLSLLRPGMVQEFKADKLSKDERKRATIINAADIYIRHNMYDCGFTGLKTARMTFRN